MIVQRREDNIMRRNCKATRSSKYCINEKIYQISVEVYPREPPVLAWPKPCTSRSKWPLLTIGHRETQFKSHKMPPSAVGQKPLEKMFTRHSSWILATWTSASWTPPCQWVTLFARSVTETNWIRAKTSKKKEKIYIQCHPRCNKPCLCR